MSEPVTQELLRQIGILEASLRCRELVIASLPRTEDGVCILPGLPVVLPFAGIVIGKGVAKSCGYVEDFIDSMDWFRGKIRWSTYGAPYLRSPKCWSTAESFLEHQSAKGIKIVRKEAVEILADLEEGRMYAAVARQKAPTP